MIAGTQMKLLRDRDHQKIVPLLSNGIGQWRLNGTLIELIRLLAALKRA